MEFGKSRTEWIEQYLMGKLSHEESLHFEQQLSTDTRLKSEVKQLQIILDGINRNNERADWIKEMHDDLKDKGQLKGYSNYKDS